MVQKCVAQGCNNAADPNRGISLHVIPFYEDSRPEAIERRQKWVTWIQDKRRRWKPSERSVLCSKHFKEEDYESSARFGGKKKLRRDSVGVCVVPSEHAESLVKSQKTPSESVLKRREKEERKRVLESAKERIAGLSPRKKARQDNPSVPVASTSTSTDTKQVELASLASQSVLTHLHELERTTDQERDCQAGHSSEAEPQVILAKETVEQAPMSGAETQVTVANENKMDVQEEQSQATRSNENLAVRNEPQATVGGCKGCTHLLHSNESLQKKKLSLNNQVAKLRRGMKKKKKELRRSAYKIKTLESTCLELERDDEQGEEDDEEDSNDKEEAKKSGDDEHEDHSEDEKEEDSADESDDPDVIEDEPPFTSESSDVLESEESISNAERSGSLPLPPYKNLRTEPKHIVFLTQLLLLFKFCPTCKEDDPCIEVHEVGTKAVVKSTCKSSKCPKPEITWHSQPFMPGTKMAAGNFLLCMSTLFSGGSATKVFQILKHMGMGCISLTAYFNCQSTKLFPAIQIYWKKQQANMLNRLKSLGEGVMLAGDGRHDSMGHSAKFCSYTIFCCTIPLIIHFAIVQRNQEGNSPGMEFLGFKQCMEYLIGHGLIITTFISDRHIQIACHMKNVLSHIRHYFDLWHLKKKLGKLLSKLTKEKGLEGLKPWAKPCETHLYWSAMSTFSGNGRVIWSKFKSFLQHVVNKHSGFADPLFNKCAHGDLGEERTWLEEGSVEHKRLEKVITNNSLQKGISQASPLEQTSCLEGFHSALNQFAPKMIAYTYVGMYCRHILASIHFNGNLKREDQIGPDGLPRIHVTYPKFKNGEATVRNQKVPPNFDYVEDLYETFLSSSAKELSDAAKELEAMAPPPMNTMLNKQDREEAIRKKAARDKMTITDVPPTCPVDAVPEQGRQTARRGGRGSRGRGTRRTRGGREVVGERDDAQRGTTRGRRGNARRQRGVRGEQRGIQRGQRETQQGATRDGQPNARRGRRGTSGRHQPRQRGNQGSQ